MIAEMEIGRGVGDNLYDHIYFSCTFVLILYICGLLVALESYPANLGTWGKQAAQKVPSNQISS